MNSEHGSQCCFGWVGDTNDDNDLVNPHSHQATRPLSSVLFLPGWSEGNVVGEGVGCCKEDNWMQGRVPSHLESSLQTLK